MTSQYTNDERKLIYSDCFNSSQSNEIRKGFDYGLTFDEVSVYAKSNFDEMKMMELRQAFEQGLPAFVVKKIAIDAYNHNQIMILKNVYLSSIHIPLHKIDYINTPAFDEFTMQKIYDYFMAGKSIEYIEEHLHTKEIKEKYYSKKDN